METLFSFPGALSFASCRETGRDFLLALREEYGARNLVYIRPSGHDGAAGPLHLVHTCGNDWEEALTGEDRAVIAAILRLGLQRIAPVDCADLPPLAGEGRGFSGVVSPLGLGPEGLLFPLHGPAGKSAVLLVSVTREKGGWEQYKHDVLAGLQTAAIHFHESMALIHDAGYCDWPARLSGRELECLQWCARGKSYWETAVILGISERTVNHYMKMVRDKLEVLTNAQAVSRAYDLGLMTPGGWREKPLAGPPANRTAGK